MGDWAGFWRQTLPWPAQLRPQMVAGLLEGEGVTGVPEVENDSLELMLGNWFGHCGLPLPRVGQWG